MWLQQHQHCIQYGKAVNALSSGHKNRKAAVDRALLEQKTEYFCFAFVLSCKVSERQ